MTNIHNYIEYYISIYLFPHMHFHFHTSQKCVNLSSLVDFLVQKSVC